MKELESSRQEINEIDAEMARLFEARMKASAEIAEYKREHGLSVRDPSREAELIEKNRRLVNDPAVESYYVQFIKKTVELSRGYQSRIMNGRKVGYCGVEGAYAHIAAKKMFPYAQLVAFADFSDAYKATESGMLDSAVLPLENSYAGEVGTVMDLMFSGSLYINQVMDMDITHNLIACEGATLQTIKTVVSHPQALEQCDDYISNHGYETKAYSNTALAAKYVQSANDTSIAAIASAETAELFNLKILDSKINASRNNTTRFAVFSMSQYVPSPASKREDENFMLVFTVQNEAGALAQTLNIIGSHGFNMRNLRSRPMKGLLWNYYFFLEAEGNINNTNGREMLQELSAVCAKLRLVGAYYENNIG